MECVYHYPSIFSNYMLDRPPPCISKRNRILHYPALCSVWTKHNASNRIKEYKQKHIMAGLFTQPPCLSCCEVWGCHSSVREDNIFLGCGTVTVRVTPNISWDHAVQQGTLLDLEDEDTKNYLPSDTAIYPTTLPSS